MMLKALNDDKDFIQPADRHENIANTKFQQEGYKYYVTSWEDFYDQTDEFKELSSINQLYDKI